MKKLLLLILMASSAAHAAGWKKISDVEGQAVYINESAISDIEGYKKAWVLLDFAQPRDGAKSNMMLWYFSCQDKKAAVMGIFGHKENLGQGSITQSVRWAIHEVQFAPLVSGTAGALVLEQACTIGNAVPPPNWKKINLKKIGFYMDENSLSEKGGYLRARFLLDFTEPIDGAKSKALLWHFSCEQKKAVMIEQTHHKENMGRGDILQGQIVKPQIPQPGKKTIQEAQVDVSAGSMEDILLQLACTYKKPIHKKV